MEYWAILLVTIYRLCTCMASKDGILVPGQAMILYVARPYPLTLACIPDLKVFRFIRKAADTLMYIYVGCASIPWAYYYCKSLLVL